MATGDIVEVVEKSESGQLPTLLQASGPAATTPPRPGSLGPPGLAHRQGPCPRACSTGGHRGHIWGTQLI